MRFSITGITVAFIVSMIAFIFSFQACDSTCRTTEVDIVEDIRECAIEPLREADDTDAVDEEKGDATDDDKDVEVIEDETDETLDTAGLYEKVELIVFDVDGSVLSTRVVENI